MLRHNPSGRTKHAASPASIHFLKKTATGVDLDSAKVSFLKFPLRGGGWGEMHDV